MNFEKFHRDIQVEDLYYFLRKVMEKKRVEAPARRWHAECVFCNPPTYQKRNRIFENPSDLSGKVLENCKFILLHE